MIKTIYIILDRSSWKSVFGCNLISNLITHQFNFQCKSTCALGRYKYFLHFKLLFVVAGATVRRYFPYCIISHVHSNHRYWFPQHFEQYPDEKTHKSFPSRSTCATKDELSTLSGSRKTQILSFSNCYISSHLLWFNTPRAFQMFLSQWILRLFSPVGKDVLLDPKTKPRK